MEIFIVEESCRDNSEDRFSQIIKELIGKTHLTDY